MERPQISEELRTAIIKIAKDNRGWSYSRIRGQLKYLNLKASIATIGNVLKKARLEPQPDRQRKTTWKEFVESHWQSLAACDFFTTEIYTIKGLTRYMVFVAIDYATRKVEIADIVEQAYGDWMVQMARNLTNPFCGFLKDMKYLIHDRDVLYTKPFTTIPTTVRYLLSDFRNSMIAKIAPNRAPDIVNYTGFGVPMIDPQAPMEGLAVLWNGYYYDHVTGNYYLRNRYYSPLERRFLTDDPHGINPDGNWNNPFSVLNQFADGFGLRVYTGGDPANNRDLWGLFSGGIKEIVVWFPNPKPPYVEKVTVG